MKVKDFSFFFSFNRKKTEVHCTEFKVGERPQVRVWFGEPLKEKVFTFYLLPKKLFWYELLPADEKIANKLASTLAKKYDLKLEKRKHLKTAA